MDTLLSAHEVTIATGGQPVQGCSPDVAITGLCIDSRHVKSGDLFICLPGARVDGHDYAAQAMGKGAALCLVSRKVPGVPAIQVADTLLGLGQIAHHLRLRHPHLPAVGVTGSVGKTTTKELVAAALAAKLQVLKTPGNLNSESGMPLVLAMLRPEHEVAVLEMGMRALGEINYLCSMAEPTIGVVTVVGESHLELLGTRENIALAKSELVQALPAHGLAVLNARDARVLAMAQQTRAAVAYYGLPPGATPDVPVDWPAGKPLGAVPADAQRVLWAEEVAADGDFGQRFVLRGRWPAVGEIRQPVALPAPGAHNVANALAAVAVALHLGLTPAEAARGLAAYVPTGGRMRRVVAGEIVILDDTYNAAPTSVVAALEVLAAQARANGGRAVAVLGDMYELGAGTVAGHRQVGAAAARTAAALVAVGPLSLDTAAGAAATGMATVLHAPDKAAALEHLRTVIEPGDVVLVKGSRGMEMEDIVSGLQNTHSRLPEGEGPNQ